MKTSRSIAKLAAVAGVTALALTACSSDGNSGEPITLTVTTFSNFGYEGPNYNLFKEYEEANNVKIVVDNKENGDAGRDYVINELASGGTLTDIVAIEEGWLATAIGFSNKFVDLRDFGANDIKDRWLDWKVGQATDPSGRIFGYGTDIGPQGISFRGDLLEAAGIPGDREGFAEYLGGKNATWERFFEVGKEYTSKTGKAFYHSPAFLWNSFVNQQTEGYYKKDAVTLNIEGNETLKAGLARLIDAEKAGLDAGLEDWGVGAQAQADEFAVYISPAWMLGTIEGYYEAGTLDSGWDFADVFPGGATNWGGAFLAVSEDSKHKEEAAKLAAWLTHPDQHLKAFENVGAFPSSKDAAAKLKAEGGKRPFFKDAPVGEILANRAEGVVAQAKGPKDSIIQSQVFGAVLNRIKQDELLDIEEAWAEVLRLVKVEVGS